jgi:hypothetical protein
MNISENNFTFSLQIEFISVIPICKVFVKKKPRKHL